jgi:hypothetical protein
MGVVGFIANLPLLAAFLALITAAWPLYVSCIYFFGQEVSIGHLSACMLVTGFFLSLVTTPLLRDRLLCYGDTYLNLFTMVAYSAGVGTLQAAAIVMSNFSLKFGGLVNDPLQVFFQGGFAVLIAVILILPVIIYAIRGTTADRSRSCR